MSCGAATHSRPSPEQTGARALSETEDLWVPAPHDYVLGPKSPYVGGTPMAQVFPIEVPLGRLLGLGFWGSGIVSGALEG